MTGWRICRERMRLDAARSGELLAVLRATTMALPEFTTKYASLWRNYARTRDSMETMNRRHHFIIAEIAAVASQTPDRFGVQGDAYLPEVLAVLILYASRTEDGFGRIVGVLGKILA